MPQATHSQHPYIILKRTSTTIFHYAELKRLLCNPTKVITPWSTGPAESGHTRWWPFFCRDPMINMVRFMKIRIFILSPNVLLQVALDISLGLRSNISSTIKPLQSEDSGKCVFKCFSVKKDNLFQAVNTTITTVVSDCKTNVWACPRDSCDSLPICLHHQKLSEAIF